MTKTSSSSSTTQIRLGLNRPEHKIDLKEPRLFLRDKLVMVTGAAGSLGQPLVAKFRSWNVAVVPTDIDTGRPVKCQYMDITNSRSVLEMVAFYEPDIIINLAANKFADQSEINPWPTVNTNINGLQNLLNMGRKVVQVSTCKAGTKYCLYGYTKAIGEKLALEANNTVVRLYNVPMSGRNAVTTWQNVPKDQPLNVAPASRYMISVSEAIGTIIWGCVLEPGRYAIHPGEATTMTDFVSRTFLGRDQIEMPLRRGDSPTELLHAPEEEMTPTRVPNLMQITNPND